jgi:hypothetical protein
LPWTKVLEWGVKDLGWPRGTTLVTVPEQTRKRLTDKLNATWERRKAEMAGAQA